MKPIGQFLKEKIEKAKDGKLGQASRPKLTTRDSAASFNSFNGLTSTGSQKDLKEFQTRIQHIDSNQSIRSFHSYRTSVKGNPWTPGVLARAPWSGLGALFWTFVLLMIGIGILVDANKKPVDRWPHFAQPSVVLSITYGLSSVLLSYALAVGLDISFWRRALHGTTLPDLHQHWFSGTSIWGALLGIRKMPWISAATLLTTMSLLHGPLLQRSITIDQIFIPENSTVHFAAARVLPDGFSGYVTGKNAVTSVLTTNFTAVLNTFRNNVFAGIPMKHDDCGTNCTGTMEGFGFDVVCVNVDATFSGATRGAIVFSTSVDYNETGEAGKIKLEGRYKATANCSGSVEVRRCTLRAGIKRYPVMFSGNNSVALISGDDKKDKFLNYTTIHPAVSGGRSTVGGLAFSIGTIFTSSVNMSYTGDPALGYTLATTGSTAAVANTTLLTIDAVGADSCGISWYDPVDDILRQIRLLTFQMSVLAANQNPTLPQSNQSTNATGGFTRTIYRANYTYLSLALLVSFAGILAVTPTYYGWWELGRTVSLSPIEIAKAFDAPLLEHVDCNGTAENMLKEIGGGRVRYGDVGLSNGRPIDPLLGGGFGRVRRRLEVFDEGFVGEAVVGGEYHPGYIAGGPVGGDEKVRFQEDVKIGLQGDVKVVPVEGEKFG